MTAWGWLLLAVGSAPLVAAVYFGMAKTAARRAAIDATSRTETINGQEYSVYTLTHPVLRERSTGRLGIALERGRENEPTTIAAKTALRPERVRVQFFRKTDGEPGRCEWRRFSTFEIVGTAMVDYLSRSTGESSAERLIRYNVDLASLASATKLSGHKPSSSTGATMAPRLVSRVVTLRRRP
jgi:hypothetical protein